MRKLLAWILFVSCAAMQHLVAQTPAAPAQKMSSQAVSSKKKQKKAKNPNENESPGNNLFGPAGAGLESNEPTTTEIYADEAFFDSTKNMGIFSGRVKVIDPRFNLQSDKLTVFITKGQNQTLEKAIAEGNVGLVRDRPDPNGGPPTRAVGRADKAVYTAATGDVELSGTPRVEEGLNMHVATSPDTVMIINQNSQLRTYGPSRTEIHQQPKEEKNGAASPAQASPVPQVSPGPALPTP